MDNHSKNVWYHIATVWDEQQKRWQAPTTPDQGATPATVRQRIKDYSNLQGPGQLYVRVFLTSDGRTSCTVNALNFANSTIQP